MSSQLRPDQPKDGTTPVTAKGQQEGLDGGAFNLQVSCTSQVSQLSHSESLGSNSLSMDVAAALSRQCTSIDKDLTAVVTEVLIRQSIEAAVAECKFVVTIADPRAKDCPLIAVSEEFENLTGFQRNEILGVNCRFLNQGCDMDPADLMALRESSRTGAPYTAVIPNRKKSGELFLNLLDVRGLNVAKDRRTGEDIWFLIGIQADVTDLAEDEVPLDHMQGLQRIADGIRIGITKELSKMAMSGLASMTCEDLDVLPEQWALLDVPIWRSSEAPIKTRWPMPTVQDESLVDEAGTERSRLLPSRTQCSPEPGAEASSSTVVATSGDCSVQPLAFAPGQSRSGVPPLVDTFDARRSGIDSHVPGAAAIGQHYHPATAPSPAAPPVPQQLAARETGSAAPAAGEAPRQKGSEGGWLLPAGIALAAAGSVTLLLTVTLSWPRRASSRRSS
mmetsp:Transcript_23212/g.61828  ORF Transcript_23212/g.61828 Transcript_23212/m.61828 type:complete len:447 (+) Transcript_23212:60-1400(+)